MNANDIRNRFWFGTHYYRPPTPTPGEWADDFRRIRDMGLTLIQVRAFWRCYEPVRDRFRWEDLDHFMDVAAEHKLRVVQQIMLENAPQYVFDDAGAYIVDIRGVRVWPISNAAMYPGGWKPCFDHPAVIDRGRNFVRMLVERYKGHPALAFWHAWNEPRSRPMGECACDHSIASYRHWLREVFGSIDVLNARFGKYWPDFDAVDAARDTCDYADMFLWKQWAAASVRQRVQAVVDTVRRCDPDHAVIAHVGLNRMQQDPLFDISDDEQMADVADLYGSSFEVRYTPEPVVHSLPFLICDWMRYVGNGKYTIYELYPSRGRFEPEIPAHQFQQWMWIPPACGARSVFLWQFKKERLGFETNDAGLIEIDGSDNPTSLAAREGFRLYQSLADDIAGWRVAQADVAIVYDGASDLVNRMEHTRQRDLDVNQGYALTCSLAAGHPYKTALQGAYHLFWRENIPVDMIDAARLDEIIEHYRIVYCPAMSVVDRQRAEHLAEYIQNGGCLIVDAPFAWRDGNTWLHPTRPIPSLADRFGYREIATQVGHDVADTATLNDGTRLDVLFVGAGFETQASGVDILAGWTDGTAAVVSCDIGKGRVIALGFSPGITISQNGDDGGPTFLNTLLAWTKQPIARYDDDLPPGDVTVRRLIDADDRDIILAFRRWGADWRIDEDAWRTWTPPNATPLFQLSHVKCFRRP